MLVIRRKEDGAFVGTVVEGMTPEQEIQINVIPNFGGTPDDYEAVECTPEPTSEPEPVDRIVELEKAILELTMLLGGGA